MFSWKINRYISMKYQSILFIVIQFCLPVNCRKLLIIDIFLYLFYNFMILSVHNGFTICLSCLTNILLILL